MSGVEFKGEEFTPRDAVNQMRVMHLAKVAQDDTGENIMHQWAALYDTVQHVLRPEDFDRFMAAGDREGVVIDELYVFVMKMLAALGERPTEPRDVSSDGPSPAPESSVSRLEQLATERFPGRPDKVAAATTRERLTDEEAELLLATLS